MWHQLNALTHMNGYDGYSGGAMWLWMGFWTIGLVALIAGALWFLARTPIRHQHTNDADPAESALRLRFARGELTEEDFHNRLNTLTNTRR